jgi:putative PIN family toxin of toxin-antitoxin system
VGKVEVKRVVIDTNVVVSALLFGGVPGRLIPLWKTGAIKPYASREMVDEYIRVLAYPKFELSEQEINFLLYHEMLAYFETIEVIPGKRIVKRDSSDDKFIWCAEAAGAPVIISGDSHLLRMKTYGMINIVSVVEFCETLRPS